MEIYLPGSKLSDAAIEHIAAAYFEVDYPATTWVHADEGRKNSYRRFLRDTWIKVLAKANCVLILKEK